MSREDFRGFARMVKHNMYLKETLSQCETSKDLILIAEKYGYCITSEDLNYDDTANKFNFLFEKIKINPLKYFK